VFGALFVLNLMVAVQFNYLDDAMNQVAAQQEKERLAAEIEKRDTQMQQELTDKIVAANGDAEEEALQKKKKKPRKTLQQHLRQRCACCFFDAQKCCCRCWLDMSAHFKKIVQSPRFTFLIVLLILLNSVVLATEHYEQPDWLSETQDIANIVFTVLFAFEMVFSMIALGIKDYFADGFNIFDSIIVVLSLIDLGITLTSSGGSGFITVLRGFRLLRIFKLVKKWTTLQQLLKTIISSLSAISNLAVLSLLFLFVYSLIGKQFFYGQMVDLKGEVTRYHFNSTVDSMITMFIVLTGENWNYVMTTVINAYPEKMYLAVFFFVSAILIGNFMLLNLFLAILLKFLQDAVDEVRVSELKDKEQKRLALQRDREMAIEVEKKQKQVFHNSIYQNEAKAQENSNQGVAANGAGEE